MCRALQRNALSLVECVVVVTILGLLAALTLGGVQRVRQAAVRAECQSRLRQLGIAAQSYHAVHHHFPAGVWYPFARTERDSHMYQSGISWHSVLLPHLEQDGLWRKVWDAHMEQPSGTSVRHDETARISIPAFRCPADGRPIGRYIDPLEEITWGLSNYLGVWGTGIYVRDGMFHPNARVAVTDVADGTANTLLIGERPTRRGGYRSSWYSGWGMLRYSGGQLLPVDRDWIETHRTGPTCPELTSTFYPGRYDDECDAFHFWSLHPGGANFAFADGSVRFLRYSANDILPALATRAGGETVSIPE